MLFWFVLYSSIMFHMTTESFFSTVLMKYESIYQAKTFKNANYEGRLYDLFSILFIFCVFL